MVQATASEKAAVEQFRTQLRGALVGPGDPDYEMARRVHYGMIDRHPRLIARCRDVADVIAAVNFGREQGLVEVKQRYDVNQNIKPA